MMVRVEKIGGVFRVAVDGEVITAPDVRIDEEEVNEKVIVEAVEVKIDEDGVVWIYTFSWALDNAIFRLETRLLRAIIGGRNG
ncbi:MAG: hypothetical protein QW517_10150 [Thermofilaceae archaeon]